MRFPGNHSVDRPQRKFQRIRICLKEKQTRRERPKSTPYLRLKNIQGTTIGNIWKKIFFQKTLLVKKSHSAEKLKKRSFRLIKRFLQTENFKKMQGGTNSKIFEKTSHSTEKKPEGGTLWSHLYFWKH